jgi:hypothetical protein
MKNSFLHCFSLKIFDFDVASCHDLDSLADILAVQGEAVANEALV